VSFWGNRWEEGLFEAAETGLSSSPKINLNSQLLRQMIKNERSDVWGTIRLLKGASLWFPSGSFSIYGGLKIFRYNTNSQRSD